MGIEGDTIANATWVYIRYLVFLKLGTVVFAVPCSQWLTVSMKLSTAVLREWGR